MYNCNEKHYVGEVGTTIYINCGVDVSAATNISILIERPDGTIIQKTALFAVYQDSNNYVRFVIGAGDLNQEGDYVGQVHLTLGSWTGDGDRFHIDVEEPISSSSSAA